MAKATEQSEPSDLDPSEQNLQTVFENQPHPVNSSGKNTIDELLRELITLIQASKTAPQKPDTWSERFKKLNDWIKSYWILGTLLAFLLAWGYYQFNPLYPFAQFKISSDEAKSKLQQFAYREKIVAHYLDQGEAFLNDAQFKEAANAYANAIDQHNLPAEYGALKSRLLDFSIAKQFDPNVIKQRLVMLRKLNPEGLSRQEDTHILYAEALLEQETGKDGKALKLKLDRGIELNNNHAPAFALRAALARRSGNFADAIADLERAVALSPYHWEYINNLAYSYQLRADLRFEQGHIEKAGSDLEKGFSLYGKTVKLDAEALAPQIEMLRLKMLYALRFQEVHDEIPNLIRLFTSEALHALAKNQIVLSYQLQLADKNQAKREFKIRTWAAKQAYLRQLQLLSNWLGKLDNTLTNKSLSSQLKRLWTLSPDAGFNLPGFLLDDLNSLQRYKAYWGRQRSISAEKIADLKSLAETEIRR